MDKPLLHRVETNDGINVIINNIWCAMFPKSALDQIDFLIENVNRVLHDVNSMGAT